MWSATFDISLSMTAWTAQREITILPVPQPIQRFLFQRHKQKGTGNHCFNILKSISDYMGLELITDDVAETERADYNDIPPNYEELARLYEEISSTFNKIYICSENGDKILAFLSAVCLQHTLSQAQQECDMPYYDILSAYHYDDLTSLASLTKRVEDDLVEMIVDGGGNIKRYANYDDFESAYLH